MLTSNFVHVNRPVNRTDYFIGRDRIMNYLIKGIKESESVYYALIGELGMGKSSILNNLCFKETQAKYQLPENVLFVMVDPLDRVACGEDFYRYIAESVANAVDKKVGMPHELVDYIHNAVDRMYSFTHKRQIERSLTSLFQEIFDHQIKVILLLDDFEKTVQTSNLDYPEFNYLRTLTSGINVNVSFIITSRKDMKFISDAANLSGFSYIFNSTIPFSPLFSDEEMDLYMNRYLNKLQLSDEELEGVKSLSGGVPTLLRYICSRLLHEQKIDTSTVSFDIISENNTYLESIVEKNEEDWRNILSEDIDDYEKMLSVKRLSTIGLINMETDPFSFTSPIFEKYVNAWWKRQKATQTGLELIAESSMSHETKVLPHPIPHITNGTETGQIREILELLFNAFKYGRETHNEVLGKEIGIRLGHMEDRISSQIQSVETTVSTHMKELREKLEDKFSDLRKNYLVDGNEDIALYASKIKEQAVILMQNDQYVTYSKEIAEQLAHVWEHLEAESREYIMIGEILQHIFDQEKMDHSPVSICYCRAFELELNRKLLPFLKGIAGDFQTRVGSRFKALSDPTIESLMLGGFFTVIAKSDYSTLIRGTMKDKGVNDKQFLQSFDIIKNIRNRTAHAERIEPVDIQSLKIHLFGELQIQGVLSNLQVIR